MSLTRFTATLCLLLAGAMSCSSIGSTYNNPKGFNLSVDQFHNALRWEAYDTALVFVSPPLVDDFWQLADILQGKIRIMEYEVRQPVMDPISGSGSVTVHFKLYHQDGPRLQTRTVREKWVYLPKEKIWQIVRHDLDELMN
jgi:hypothetical protein